MIELTKFRDDQLVDIAARALTELRVRMASPKWECVECHHFQPAGHYRYEAKHKKTGAIARPVCALCIRGETSRRFVETDETTRLSLWEHIGPLQ
jgi:hypothetical protein